MSDTKLYQVADNPAAVREWVAALRSGDYVQAHNALSNDIDTSGDVGWVTGYCCLGVACVVAQNASFQDVDFDNSYPPKWVTDFFGFKLASNDVPLGYGDNDSDAGTDLYDYLALKNDARGWTFDQIADWVEDNLL